MTRIREGSVHMRTREYFYLEVFATSMVAVLVLLLSVLIFNFILFGIFAGHHEPLLAQGVPGLLIFLKLFPWPLLAADILLLILLRVLLKRFEIAYRSPTLYVLLALLVIIGSSGFILYHQTDVNERIEREAHRGHLPPPVGRFFDESRKPPPDATPRPQLPNQM